MKNRVINKWFLVGFACVGLALILVFRVPSFVRHNKLVALGYDDASIAGLKKQGLTSQVLKNEYYSEYFAQEVCKDSFKKEYLQLYLKTNKVDDEVIELYTKLQNKGYNEEQIIDLLVNLKDYEIIPLLVFAKQDDLTPYIDDCKNHPTNTAAKFVLSGNYFDENEEIQTNPFSYTVLVNNTHAIDCSTVTNLTEMSMSYASKGLKLENEAYSHFIEMISALRADGLDTYATDSYRTYDEQAALVAIGGSEPGHSEFNTGLAVLLQGESFATSAEYEWLKKNAANYGFIQRYTDEKLYITRQPDSMSRLWRYVGVEAAQTMKEKKMCFEEYYAYYVEGAQPVTEGAE